MLCHNCSTCCLLLFVYLFVFFYQTAGILQMCSASLKVLYKCSKTIHTQPQRKELVWRRSLPCPVDDNYHSWLCIELTSDECEHKWQQTLHLIDCTESRDKIRVRVERESYVCCCFSIPIDFCIEFWNSTFPPVLEFTEGIFLTTLARAFQWCKPHMRSCFHLKLFLQPTQLGHTIMDSRV